MLTIRGWNVYPFDSESSDLSDGFQCPHGFRCSTRNWGQSGTRITLPSGTTPETRRFGESPKPQRSPCHPGVGRLRTFRSDTPSSDVAPLCRYQHPTPPVRLPRGLSPPPPSSLFHFPVDPSFVLREKQGPLYESRFRDGGSVGPTWWSLRTGPTVLVTGCCRGPGPGEDAGVRRDRVREKRCSLKSFTIPAPRRVSRSTPRKEVWVGLPGFVGLPFPRRTSGLETPV